MTTKDRAEIFARLAELANEAAIRATFPTGVLGVFAQVLRAEAAKDQGPPHLDLIDRIERVNTDGTVTVRDCQCHECQRAVSWLRGIK